MGRKMVEGSRDEIGRDGWEGKIRDSMRRKGMKREGRKREGKR